MHSTLMYVLEFRLRSVAFEKSRVGQNHAKEAHCFIIRQWPQPLLHLLHVYVILYRQVQNLEAIENYLRSHSKPEMLVYVI
jgi:hypothetical protein